MQPIRKKDLKEMLEDPDYSRCISCRNRSSVEFHHAFTYARKQIPDKWAIAPLCAVCHRGNFGRIKRRADRDSQLWCLARSTQSDLDKYQKFDWEQLKKRLK